MIIINLLGLLLIGLIVWWFWLYKAKEVTADKGVITIKVENGTYEPSRVRVEAGKPITLRFLRKDASPCAATVVFADFDISEELPLNKNKDVFLLPGAPGEYSFTCQMQMYRGTLIIMDKK
ncbi:cupredoxin domain-containing protein [Vibrio sp. EA2]|uniref:cupredoxin domain-containing protein n=1 Tax=Vibrio sp. EA2 TaxID=3079860 RepID=UPI002948FF84|nr:cupredoxin domain-containing protein [Vibrio sp. EA2]MDV6250986.1 cupredoxin domain-containing protein [Vibrio sp. EA2]